MTHFFDQTEHIRTKVKFGTHFKNFWQSTNSSTAGADRYCHYEHLSRDWNMVPRILFFSGIFGRTRTTGTNCQLSQLSLLIRSCRRTELNVAIPATWCHRYETKRQVLQVRTVLKTQKTRNLVFPQLSHSFTLFLGRSDAGSSFKWRIQSFVWKETSRLKLSWSTHVPWLHAPVMGIWTGGYDKLVREQNGAI